MNEKPSTDNPYNIDIPEGEYSASEVRHFISRAIVQSQIKELNSRMDFHQTEFTKLLSELTKRFDEMAVMLSDHHRSVDRRFQDHENRTATYLSFKNDTEVTLEDQGKRISSIEIEVPEFKRTSTVISNALLWTAGVVAVAVIALVIKK